MKITELPNTEQSKAAYMWSISRNIENHLRALGIVLELDKVEEKYLLKIGSRRNINNNLLQGIAYEMHLLDSKYQQDLASSTLIRFAGQLACSPENLINLSNILGIPIAATQHSVN